MKILVVNSGSSSIKYRLFQMPEQRELCGGLVERIGDPDASAVLHHWTDAAGHRQAWRHQEPVPDYETGLIGILAAIRESGLLGGAEDLHSVGHRVVHGGERFTAPVRIDGAVIDDIRALIPLAPLHNPANLAGIETFARLYPRLPQVAVFDTAFHQTIPPHAYRYAVPEYWYRDHGVRRYGFHGTSHQYVARLAAAHLGVEPAALHLISLHLGNGASAAAIKAGRCVDTSMGLTPLEGLVMGTRSGDMDPAILFHMARETGRDLEELERDLTVHSGLAGLSGENDMRAVHRLAAAGDQGARLAIDVYCYRVRKYVGAYAAALGRLDALVFTAGVGENDVEIRSRICDGLQWLGIWMDEARNRQSAPENGLSIHADDSPVKLLVIPTNEELEIALSTQRCLAG